MAETRGTVTLSVASQGEFAGRLRQAFAGRAQGDHISFASPELLWRTMTAKRWDILKALAGEEPLSIREIARRVGRDVKAVHGDVTALVLAGILDRSAKGVSFPYSAVHVDFVLNAA